MKQLFKILLAPLVAVVLLIGLTGCETLKNVFRGENDTALRGAVFAGVSGLIANNPENRGRIVDLTSTARAYLDANPQARAGQIVDQVRSEIDWEKLTENQSILATTLLAVIEDEIRKRLDEGVVKERDRAKVREIIDWIEQAALLV